MSLSGVVYWLVGRQQISKNIFQICLFGYTIITLLISPLLTIELFADYQDQLVYNDSTYRIEYTNRGIMNSCNLPALFVKSRFYEREYTFSQGYCITKWQIKKVEVKFISTSKISVTYFLTTNIHEGTPNPLNIIYFEK